MYISPPPDPDSPRPPRTAEVEATQHDTAQRQQDTNACPPALLLGGRGGGDDDGDDNSNNNNNNGDGRFASSHKARI
ncbi:hypothetical protein LX36DRAFT_715388 [Colletotrichum falcatum]|nr:hypothetical protein LX36DRAFT_715388 [Colletotrichum falcatum]